MADDVPVDAFSRDCPDCGAVVAADATRCPDCGATLDGESGSAPVDSGRSGGGAGRESGGPPDDGPTTATQEASGDGNDVRAAGEEFSRVGRELEAELADGLEGAGGIEVGDGTDDGVDHVADAHGTGDVDNSAEADGATDDTASWIAFALAAATVVYLYVSYGMLLFPSTVAVARSDPVLYADAAAFVVLPLAALADATLVRRAGTWSPRRWLWGPLVVVPLLNLLTGPVYLAVRFWRT